MPVGLQDSLIILALRPGFPPPLLSPPAIRVYTKAKLPKAQLYPALKLTTAPQHQVSKL